MSQRLLYVMGPSGAGKDSLLAWLRARLPPALPLHWARRTISRAAEAGGEAHESVDASTFERLRDAQAFGLHWAAHDLLYGVRHQELAPLQAGRWVLLNGSRAYLPEAQQHYPELTVLHITASAEVLQQRLLARGRESADTVAQRVQRAGAYRPGPAQRLIEVHNDGTLDAAGAQLLQALQQLEGWPAPGRV